MIFYFTVRYVYVNNINQMENIMFNLATHNGTITMENPKTGQHRVVMVKTQPSESSFAPNERIISIQVGSSNERDFNGIGFVKDGGKVVVWRKHRNTKNEQIVRMMEDPTYWQALGIKFHFAGKCRRCNRKLTTPESIESGIGPVCAGRE